MLAIRMQRTGRKGHASYRVVVQDSRQTPTSGKYVALLGNYDPHTKAVSISKEKAETYLSNGAQPSERVARLLKEQGVVLPSWVVVGTKKTGVIRHAEKLRRNRSDEPKAEAAEAEPEADAETVTDVPDIEENVASEASDASNDEVAESTEAEPAAE